MSVHTPEALALVRHIDRALRLADHHPVRVDRAGSGLATEWPVVGPLVQARALLFLAQRAGDALQGPALDKLAAHMGWPTPPGPGDVLAVTDHLSDPDVSVRALDAALALAALVYEQGQAPCGFCRIADDEDPHVRIIDERDDTVAFVPRDPSTGVSGGLVGGHWLVIPRVHVPSAVSAPAVSALVFEHLADLARDRGPDELNIIFSVGAAATATVDHCHGHLVPREAGDGFRLPWDPHGHQNRPTTH